MISLSNLWTDVLPFFSAVELFSSTLKYPQSKSDRFKSDLPDQMIQYFLLNCTIVQWDFRTTVLSFQLLPASSFHPVFRFINLESYCHLEASAPSHPLHSCSPIISTLPPHVPLSAPQSRCVGPGPVAYLLRYSTYPVLILSVCFNYIQDRISHTWFKKECSYCLDSPFVVCCICKCYICASSHTDIPKFCCYALWSLGSQLHGS